MAKKQEAMLKYHQWALRGRTLGVENALLQTRQVRALGRRTSLGQTLIMRSDRPRQLAEQGFAVRELTLSEPVILAGARAGQFA